MLFFDFEVFRYDFMVVLIDTNTRETIKVHNDYDKVREIYNAHQNDLWAGYNVVHYDQYILKGALFNMNLKNINDAIIIDKTPGWEICKDFNKIPLTLYDCGDKTKSLKVYEGFMGSDIRETEVPFDIDRPLTPEEIEMTFKYCSHDVEESIKKFIYTIDEFNTKMFFIKHFNLPISRLSKTKAQLAAEILGANGRGKKEDEFKFRILPCIQLNKYKYIADWYRNPENHDYEKFQEVVVAGVPHKYSWGGGHGAIKKYHSVGVFGMIDVTAYYPSLQKQYKFGYEVMSNPENFEFIHDSNLQYKALGDKKARMPFKIMDNAISGQMKQPTSKLYCPRDNNNICINGMLLLLDLIEHLEPYIKLIQNNTDGILIEFKDYERDFDIVDDIVYEWECRTGMKMEIDVYIGELYQKDVNNYLLIDRETGDVKSKGAYVKKLSVIDYNLPIVNEAVNEYMINHTPVEETVNKCDNMHKFQMIVALQGSYKWCIHNDDISQNKCYRVFASKVPTDGIIYKCKDLRSPEKFQDTPEHCFIYNDEVVDMPCLEKLDKQWYIDVAKDRLDQFGVEIS